MKFIHIAYLLTVSTFGLAGCQTSKNLLNGFMGGNLNVAQLPNQSSSRIQFVINDTSGHFIASPNSTVVKVNGKSEGLVASAFTNQLLNKEDKFKTTQMNLNMPKPISTSKYSKVVERYVNPSEQIYIKYRMGTNNGTTTSNCAINGRFTPEANTDYRITGRSDYKKCYVLLEKFVKNTDGTISLQPMRFE